MNAAIWIRTVNNSMDGVGRDAKRIDVKHTLAPLAAVLLALPVSLRAAPGRGGNAPPPAIAGGPGATSIVLAAHAVRDQVVPQERIVIGRGEVGAAFRLRDSGRPFFVRGFNYIRLRAGDHATFDADTRSTQGCYDADRAEAMFVAVRQGGYNTVRVFLLGRSRVNPGIAGDYDTTRAIYEPYLENVLDFLRRATRHGIRVLPAFGDGELPLNAYYRERVRGKGHNKNVTILTTEGVAAKVEHMTAVLSFIRNREPALLPTLLGVQCQNETCLHADQWPFSETNGVFLAANGKTYDLAKTGERQALMDEGFRHYHERIVAAVREVDPGLLVTDGVFVPLAVGKDAQQHAGLWPGRMPDDRHPPTLISLGTGGLDFLDVHFYRTRAGESVEEAFRRDLESTGFFAPGMDEARKAKPVILGEFGAFESVEKTFAEAVASIVHIRDLALREHLNGMLYWTYDCFEQPLLHHAATDWPLFVGQLGDFQGGGKAVD